MTIKHIKLLAGVLCGIVAHGQIQAADAIWQSTIDGNWNVAGNWNPAVPGAASGTTNADTATFNTGTGVTVTVDSTRNIRSILFDTGAGSFTLSGGSLMLSSGGSVQMAGTILGDDLTQTIGSNIRLAGSSSTASSIIYTISNNSVSPDNRFLISGNITSNATTNTSNLALSGSNVGNNVISGIISNGTSTNKVAITKSGTGTWAFTNANTYSGATTLSSGVLEFSGYQGAAQNSLITVSSQGTLAIDSSSGTYASSVTRGAGVVMRGGRMLVSGSADGSTNDVFTGALTIGNTGTGGGGSSDKLNVITLTPNAATATELTFDSLYRFGGGGNEQGGGVALINGVNLGSTASTNAARVKFTTAPTFKGSTIDGGTAPGTTKNLGIISYLVGEIDSSGNGTATGTANTFLTYNATTGLRPLHLTDEFTNNAIVAGDNIRITTNTSAAGAAINSLLISGGNLTISSGSMANASGLVLFTSSNTIGGSGTLSLNGGSAIVVNAGGVDAVISAPVAMNPAGNMMYNIGEGSTLTLSGGHTAGSDNNQQISVAGGGSLFTTTGNFGGLNGWGGTLYVGGDTLLSIGGNTTVLGSLAYSIAGGGMVDLNTSSGVPAASSIGGSGSLKLGNSLSITSGASATFSGTITGGRGITIAANSNTATFSGTNTYAGGTTISGTSATALSISGGAALSDTGFLALNSTGGLVLGGSETIGTLTGTNAAGNINNSGGSTLTLTINTAVAGDGTFAGILRASGAANRLQIVKKGINTETFTGLNTYTGSTTVQNGTLALDLATNTTGVLASGGSLTLSGGSLAVKGAASGSSSQALGNLTLNGRGRIVVNQNGGSGTTLTLGDTWNRSAGSTLGIDLSSGAGAVLTSNPSASLTNGIIGYATVKDGSGTGFAMVSGGNVSRYTGATTLSSNSDSATTNFSTSGNLTLDNSSRSLNSLEINTAGGGSLDLGGSSNVATLTSGAVLATGTGNYSIANGQLGANDAELIIHHMGSGELGLNGTLSGGTGSVSIDGTGLVSIAGTNSYSGGTNLNGAIARFSSLSNLGSGGINFNGGTLQYAEGNTADLTSRAVTLTGAGGTIDTNGNNIVLAGAISGNGGLAKTGGGTLTLSGLNTYSGDTTVAKGMLTLNLAVHNTGVVNAASALIGEGGTLNVKGGATGTSSQTLGGLALRAGATSVVVDSNGGTGTTLTINNGWSRVVGTTVNFNTSSAGSSLQARDVANSGGIIGGWATVTDATGTGFATYVNNPGVVTNPVVRATSFSTLGTGTTNSAVNYMTSGSITQTGSRSINSLTIDTSSGLGGLNMGSAARILTVSSGGILMKGANDYTMSNGQFGASNAELIVNQYGTGKMTISGTVSGGTGSLTKTGPGTLEVSSINTYTGATNVNAGILSITGTIGGTSRVNVNGGIFNYANNGTGLDRAVVVSGGDFKYNSTQAYTGALTFTSGTVSGSGNLSNTALEIGTNRTLSPGNSPGTISTGAETWADGGTYLWEINALTTSAIPGTEGGNPGWDFANISGLLSITAGVGQFDLNVDSLLALDNWDNEQTYQWRIATASGGVTGFSADVFNINSAAFADQNPLNGIFSVSNVGNDIFLNYTMVPEPSTCALMGMGVFWGLRRRRTKA